MSTQLYSEVFTCTDVTKGQFERVNRISAQSESEMSLKLDINSELYPMQRDVRFTLTLASTLQTEGEKDATNARDVWRPGKGGIADDYEYVMYGKVFKFDEGTADVVICYVSFGGLLMALEGPYRYLRDIQVNQNVYLLIRRS